MKMTITINSCDKWLEWGSEDDEIKVTDMFETLCAYLCSPIKLHSFELVRFLVVPGTVNYSVFDFIGSSIREGARCSKLSPDALHWYHNLSIQHSTDTTKVY